ncbi:Cytochrome P450 9e2 [Pseudolycoriella hygida]|uniref:Cytochrome P450 9e2 n=1 Tax=Pseudolycoriella hygida TaxID=35572 RepID=A0A9Q0N0J6_9DIPT|nr:Cytochrome P450 9e2 [Pseudolycoriella hygida]
MMLLIAIAAVALFLFYKYLARNHDFFKKIGVKSMKPFFLLGNTGSILLKRISMGNGILWLYNAFPNEKITGFFDFLTPVFMIRDPELIKRLAIKEFDHFQDHKSLIDSDADPILGNILTALKGQKWKSMRSTLSPAFTGKKMRLMFELIDECSGQVVNYFLKQNASDEGTKSVDMKDLFSRFTNDVVATCAFGIKVDSQENKDNEFFKMAREVMNGPKLKSFFKLFLFRTFPKLSAKFKVRLMSERLTTFFNSLILDTMAERERKQIFRPDMINIIMQVRKGSLNKEGLEEKNDSNEGFATVTEFSSKTDSKNEWSDDELVAQCLLFFLAGFETSSNLLSFLGNELALNPEIQEKLCREIDETVECMKNEKLTYELLNSLKYLDQVISECLRKWPPAMITDRICNKEITVIVDGQAITMKERQQFWIPIYGLHMDPKYFPDPERFNPERYNEENVANIVPGSYVPFGIGPRNCIGSRFALLQIKAVVFHLMKSFTFEICEKTTVPLAMGRFTVLPDKGIHLELRKRNNAPSS